MRRADIIIDLPLGQQAEFVGTPLLDDLQIGMRFAQAGDMLRRFGRLVRPRHGHPQAGVLRPLFERQLPPARDDLVVSVFGGGIRRDMLLDVGTRIAPGDVHLFEIGDINDRPHADVVLHQGDIHGKFVVSLDEFDRSVERIDQPVQLPVTAFVVAHLAALLTQDRDARAAQIFADGFVC